MSLASCHVILVTTGQSGHVWTSLATMLWLPCQEINQQCKRGCWVWTVDCGYLQAFKFFLWREKVRQQGLRQTIYNQYRIHWDCNWLHPHCNSTLTFHTQFLHLGFSLLSLQILMFLFYSTGKNVKLWQLWICSERGLKTFNEGVQRQISNTCFKVLER